MKKEKDIIAMPDLQEARKRNKTIDVERMDYALDPKYKEVGKGKKYFILTYGCQGNEADSEIMSGILEQVGFTKGTDEFTSDLVLLNTCAVRENAEDRIWGVLGSLKGRKKDNPGMLIGICGCMPQEEKATNKIISTYNVDIIFGTHNRHHLPKLIYEAYNKNSKVVEVISNEGNIVEKAPIVRVSKHKAWVTIMYGCDEFCTYCIVPYTRGTERSRLKDDIINEVKQLVSEGYKEITLLGQNVNAYGKDLGSDYTFGNLLYDLDKTGIERIRYTTSHPRDLDTLTINAMRDCKSVMPHLHLPVQSGDNHILKIMNRKYTHELYMEKINELKREIPDISITTDIIVGFPNETEEEFQHTLDLVREVGYEGAYTFIYSPREGTPAAKMEDNTPQEEKKDRLNRLIALTNEGYLKGHQRFVGRVVKVLVDGQSKNGEGMMCGYSEHNKLTHFKSEDMSLIGKIVNVRVTEAKTWFMIGELVED